MRVCVGSRTNAAGRWMLFFDNADDVQLRLKKFFPQPDLEISWLQHATKSFVFAAKGSNENVTGHGSRRRKNLLLHLSRAEETDENKVLADRLYRYLLSFSFKK
jgi:hypothetical protein